MQTRAHPSCIERTIQQVTRAIEQFDMFTAGDRVLIGVSGGADSVALLFILFDLAEKLQISLGAAYLNHGLRPQEAHKESLFVMGLADRLGIAGHTGRVNLGGNSGSLEDRARNARYRFFAQTALAHRYNKIALAHHADDNAELVLMRLLRGSGSRGLAGIPPVRAGGIVRPLLFVRKTQLLAYLRQRSLTHMEDASNHDLRFLRNRIRHQLLPLLEKEYNPKIVATLNSMAYRFRDEDAWEQSQTTPLARAIVLHCDSNGIELDADLLHTHPPAVRRRLVRAALQAWRGTLWGITAEHVDALISLSFRTERCRGGLCLPGGIYAERTGTSLRLTLHKAPRGKAAPLPSMLFTYTIDRPGHTPVTVNIAESGYRLNFTLSSISPVEITHTGNEFVAWFDANQLVFPLQVRNFRPGDRIRPLGMPGTQKLQDLFVNRKIAAPLRTRLPLLLSQDEIIWVVGVRRSAHALVTDACSLWLCVEAVS